MSFFSIFIFLLIALVLYYVGMIAYDLYVADHGKAVTARVEDEEIDISSELEGFSSIDVGEMQISGNKDKTASVGMDIDSLKRLMEDAAYGRSNEGLRNITYKCLAAS